MKITVHRHNLERALILVERVTAKNATLPILGNILLKTDGGRLKLCATNLEVAVTVVIGAKVSSEGSVAVPARVLSDVVRASTSETVSLSLSKLTLTVEVGSYETSILCFDPTEYPIIPSIQGGVSCSLASSTLKKSLTAVIDSVASSDARPELAGAYIQLTPKGIIFTATDSFRLVEQHIPIPQSKTLSAILPRGMVVEVIRALSDTEDEVAIRIADNQCAITFDDYTLVSRLIDGRYPDYQKVIPERALSRALVSRTDLESAIKVAGLFSSSISDVHIKCTEKNITITGKNSARGEGRATVEANLKGDPFEISLNYHYLLEGLKALPNERVVLEFTGKGSPFVFRPVDDSDFVYLIMPLRGAA